MTVDELHMLAGYQAAIEIDLLPDTVTIDNLRPHLPSLYPSHMLDRGVFTKVMSLLFRSSGSGLENKMIESYKLACQMRDGCDPFNLKVLYLQLCWSKPFYGYVPFFMSLFHVFCVHIPCLLCHHSMFFVDPIPCLACCLSSMPFGIATPFCVPLLTMSLVT